MKKTLEQFIEAYLKDVKCSQKTKEAIYAGYCAAYSEIDLKEIEQRMARVHRNEETPQT